MAKTTTKSTNSPVFTLRRKGVSVSVFENQSSEGKPFLKASIQRTYKEEGGEFKTTNSYSLSDLFVLEHVIGKAKEFMLDTEANRNKEEE